MEKKEYKIEKLTPREKKELIFTINHRRESPVSPKMEQFRGFPVTFMGARGGRGAGAKTRGFINLIVQEAHKEKHAYVMLREIQKSIQDSLYKAIKEQVERLMYPGWKFTDIKITSKAGSEFAFRGLKDLRAANAIKGLEGFDRIFLDEAAHISPTSIKLLLPTILRNDGPRVMFAYNPESDYDPITKLVWNRYRNRPEKALLIEMEPCGIDNPWWNDEMEDASQMLKEEDLDDWLHTYGGHPRVQGERSIISRVHIEEAAERNIIDPQGMLQLGVDVARFGDDKTVIYARRGLKVLDCKKWTGQDTMQTAKEAWAMANNDPDVLIVVDDTGVGGGVTDKLKELGANVRPFIASAKAKKKDKYVNANAELWFSFPIREADIPDDPALIQQLSGRQYDFDNAGRKKIELKDTYKKRIGASPDEADALLMCFYDVAVPRSKAFIRSRPMDMSY